MSTDSFPAILSAMKHFFVTGYPRSGTAWMATFLSGCPGVSCSHEALRHLSRIEDLPEALGSAPFAGTSDSGLPYFLGEVEAMFPDAAWILLDRAETPSRASLSAFLGHEPAPGLYEALRAPLARIREKALVIPFEELTALSSAAKVLRHIGWFNAEVGESGWTPAGQATDWWRHMRHLRVTVKREAYEDLRLDTPIARRIGELIRREAA